MLSTPLSIDLVSLVFVQYYLSLYYCNIVIVSSLYEKKQKYQSQVVVNSKNKTQRDSKGRRHF